MRFLKIFLLFFILSSGNSFASTLASPVPSPVKYNAYNGSQTLLGGYVPQEVASSTFRGRAQASESFDLELIMPLGPGVDDFIKGVNDPKSSNYHKYLSSQDFNKRFGPSSADAEGVKKYLSLHGFSIGSQSSDGIILHVTASASSIRNVFNVNINHYTDSIGRAFFASDANPSIPLELTGKVSAISGLDNHPRGVAHIHRVASNHSTPTAQGSSVPYAGTLTPAMVSTAYNLNSIPSKGDGQTVALFEFGGYNPADIVAYDTYFKIPTPNLQNILIDNFNGLVSPSIDSNEITADIELLTAFAPNLSKVLVYEAALSNQHGWSDEWDAIADQNLAKVISTSWGTLGEVFSSTNGFDSGIFKKMAAQGQEVFVASGDCGSYADTGGTSTGDATCVDANYIGDNEPAAQPYVTAVGITNLTINPDNSYGGETASAYSGGGVSYWNAIPSYQQGMINPAITLGSTTMRNVPDVSLAADPSQNGYAIYVYGTWGAVAGSSLSAPIWAAFNALVNEGRAADNQTPLGFINPVLYQIAQSASYVKDFHPITSGSNNYQVSSNKYYPAASGSNDAVGLGSFNGLNLYNDLVLPAAPTGLTATTTGPGIYLSWVAGNGDSTYTVQRATSPTGQYTTLASGITSLGYLDTAITSGSTYYYVVFGTNFSGPSPSSPSLSIVNSVKYAITASAASGGTISPSLVNVNPTASQMFTITAPNGYTPILTEDGAPVPVTSTATANTYTFTLTNVSAAHALQVSYLLPTILSGSPMGKQQSFAFSETLAVTTNENMECKYGQISSPPPSNISYTSSAYASLPNTFSTTGGKLHQQGISVAMSLNTYQYYIVLCQDQFQNTTPSAQVIGFLVPPPSAPSAPGLLKVTLGTNGMQNILTWNASSAGTGITLAYYVYRARQVTATVTTPFSILTATQATTFTDSAVSDGKTYIYYVKAFITLPNTPTSQASNTVSDTIPNVITNSAPGGGTLSPTVLNVNSTASQTQTILNEPPNPPSPPSPSTP